MHNLSHAIRRFNRFELKYLVPLQDAERFRQALGVHLLPDAWGRWKARRHSQTDSNRMDVSGGP